MNKSDWQSRLIELQRQEKALWVKIRKLQTDIAECFTAIEGKRRRELLARKDIRYGSQI